MVQLGQPLGVDAVYGSLEGEGALFFRLQFFGAAKLGVRSDLRHLPTFHQRPYVLTRASNGHGQAITPEDFLNLLVC